MKQKPYQRNKYLRCTPSYIFGTLFKWTRGEFKQMDQRKRKLMTMHQTLHPRDDADKLYVLRKERGRGLASIEDSVDASIQRLEDCVEKH